MQLRCRLSRHDNERTEVFITATSAVTLGNDFLASNTFGQWRELPHYGASWNRLLTPV